MKEVVNQDQSTVIHFTNVSSERYYGVVLGDARGFVTMTGYNEGTYTARCVDSLTQGNGWSEEGHETTSLSEFLGRILEDGNRVYEFSSYKELLAWLVKG